MATSQIIPSPKNVETIFQDATLQALGIDPASDPDAYSKVRIGWQMVGQPSQDISQDVCYVRAVQQDSETSRIRDVAFTKNDDSSLVKATSYQRVWKIFWVFYGPTSFDHARILNSALFSDAIHDLLSASGLYWVTDAHVPRRIPEEDDGQWWERVDFEAEFNELAVEVEIIPAINSTEVLIYNAQGLQRDVEIQPEDGN